MPVIFVKQYKPDIVVGVWKISESLDTLLFLYNPQGDDKEYYDRFLVEKRRKQWLATRILVRQLLGNREMHILYDEHGKPYSPDSGMHFSLSHSGNHAAAILSLHKPVGIDIEKATDKLERVRGRFLRAEEESALDNGNRMEQLCLYWCAKEALYKVYGKRKLDFKEDIRIDLYSHRASSFRIKGRITAGGPGREYLLRYEMLGDYYVVHTL